MDCFQFAVINVYTGEKEENVTDFMCLRVINLCRHTLLLLATVYSVYLIVP